MDPYKILGLSSNATLDDIKVAYFERAKRYHPDAGGDTWAFQQLQEAYEQLLKRHDQSKAENSIFPSSQEFHAVDPKPFGTFLSEVNWQRWKMPLILTSTCSLCLVFVFWSSVWRILFVLISVTLGIIAAFLFVNASTQTEADKNSYVEGGVVASLFALLFGSIPIIVWAVGTSDKTTSKILDIPSNVEMKEAISKGERVAESAYLLTVANGLLLAAPIKSLEEMKPAAIQRSSEIPVFRQKLIAAEEEYYKFRKELLGLRKKYENAIADTSLPSDPLLIRLSQKNEEILGEYASLWSDLRDCLYSVEIAGRRSESGELLLETLIRGANGDPLGTYYDQRRQGDAHYIRLSQIQDRLSRLLKGSQTLLNEFQPLRERYLPPAVGSEHLKTSNPMVDESVPPYRHSQRKIIVAEKSQTPTYQGSYNWYVTMRWLLFFCVVIPALGRFVSTSLMSRKSKHG